MATFREKWHQYREITFESEEGRGRRWPEMPVIMKADGSIDEIPNGNNNLAGLAMFTQRKYYKDWVYPDENPTAFDLWYDKLFFGKIDPNGDAIFLQETFLKQLSCPTDQDIWVLDFVADAFNDFKSHFLFSNKRISDGTVFDNLIPRRGWDSTSLSYTNYLKAIYERFVAGFLPKKRREERLLNFNDFMKIFLEFIRDNSGVLPITFSQFIYSNYSSPMASGLMVEITSDSHGNDADKYNNFINNQNFECYRRSAQRYGFKIDKNMPGRLIADIKSPAMQKYIKKYPKKPEPVQMEEPVQPVFTFREPPLAQPDNPYEVGDRVQFAVVRPQSEGGPTGEPYFILRDYTDLQNRKYKIGKIPKRSLVEGKGMVSEYDQLKENFIGQNFEEEQPGFISVKIINAQILRPNPTLEERILFKTRPGFVVGRRGVQGGEDTIAVTVTAPTSAQTQQTATEAWRLHAEAEEETPEVNYAPNDQIVLVEVKVGKEYQDEFQSEMSSEDQQVALEMLTNVVQGASLSNLNDGYTYGAHQKSYGRDENGRWVGSYVIEVPRDAIHLNPAANAITINRFDQRINYQSRLDSWTNEHHKKLTHWRNTSLADYNRLTITYNERINDYEKKLNYFNITPSLAPDNLMERRFKKAYTWDLFQLRQICMQFYHIFTTLKPSVTIYKTLSCPNSFSPLTKSKLMFRQLISHEYINKNYSKEYWLKIYTKIRNHEASNPLDENEITKVISQAILILRQHTEWKAMEYVNEQFKNFMLTTTI